MPPTGPAESSAGLKGLSRDALREAARIYLDLAYPDGAAYPDAVRRRLEWPEAEEVETLLALPPFERAGKNSGNGTPIHALRLGNARYPHMKLQVQPWPNKDGYLLSVNTHDQVLALDPTSTDVAAFRNLQAENQKVKEAIEQAWDAAGLPTFLSYLRGYIEQRSGG